MLEHKVATKPASYAEIDPKDVKIWHREDRFDLTDCTRIYIYRGPAKGDFRSRDYIEFQNGATTSTYCLDKEPFDILKLKDGKLESYGPPIRPSIDSSLN